MKHTLARRGAAGALAAVSIAASVGAAAAPRFTNEFPIERGQPILPPDARATGLLQQSALRRRRRLR